MEETDLTFGRAFKVWWSYTWRVMVLSLPVLLAMAFLMKLALPFPKPGEPQMRPDQMQGFIPKFFLMWAIMMGTSICLQVVALRWALNVKWFGFRLKVLSVFEESPANPP